MTLSSTIPTAASHHDLNVSGELTHLPALPDFTVASGTRVLLSRGPIITPLFGSFSPIPSLLPYHSITHPSLSPPSNISSLLVSPPPTQFSPFSIDGHVKILAMSCLTSYIILILFLLLVPPLGTAAAVESYATKFDFTSLTLTSLKLLGDAHLKNGSIRLSRDLPVPNSGAGRALYAFPVRIRHPTTHSPIPFSTTFSFTIINLNPSSIGGGIAFLLTYDDKFLGDAGGFLGLTATSATPPPPLLAVEFDTLMDVEFDDINGNHVGVDLNSLVSAQVADLDSAAIDLKSGDSINVWIDYSDGLLNVFISYATTRPIDPLFSFPVDIGKYLDSDIAYVGFSGSTQGSTEIHSVDSWSFSSVSPTITTSTTNSTPPPAPSNESSSSLPPDLAPSDSFWIGAESPRNATTILTAPGPPRRHRRVGPGAVAGAATAGAFFFVACAGLVIYGFVTRTRRTRAKTLLNWDLGEASEIAKSSPREFSYKELSAATHGFDSTRIIGHGAFGTVYKGIIPATGAMIAVKRCINNTGSGSEQAKAEFLSELCIIASLRHRNLVRLQGYCRDKGEILLVYDYMLHGSLDKALFDQREPPLAWRHRKKILTGVASALAYLHHECERRVIHRDVKSSNVMLDSGYHARLGDFGLARQVEHDKSPDATVAAGTMGYLAPEYLLTGRATEKTDVFSFGAVVLEVACGRRPIEGEDVGKPGPRPSSSKRWSNLVEWVWGLYGEGRVVEAADARLEGEFDEGEMRRVMMVGLACSSPDPMARPGMRAVVQMLSGEAEPPMVPRAKPPMSFSTNAQQLITSLQDSVSDYNAIGLNLSSSSSSSDISLTSTFRGGGGGSSGVWIKPPPPPNWL